MEFNFNGTTTGSYPVPTLEIRNDQRYKVLIPALIFVIMFMLIGLVGNGVVIYIYGWRLRNSSINVLLLMLACFDMLCCVIGLPLQVVELRLNLIYPSNHLCKLGAFITFYCCNASILTLMAICGLRYHKICRSSQQQMTVSQAWSMAIAIALIALPLTIPAAVFFAVEDIPIGDGLTARLCLFKSYDELWIYFTVLFIYNLITLIAMFVLYGRIWITVRNHDEMLRKRQSESSTMASPRKPRTKNRIFVGITALYAVGFLPGLLLGVLYPLYQNFRFPDGLEAVRNIAFRLWILNSTLNPVIYGFFGLRFRREAKEIFMRSLSRQKSVECSTSELQE